MLQITEIHPNPEGKDTTNEWIEITNLGPDPINLQNYTIDDEEGGSKPYTIENPTILQPNQFHIITKQESALNLNNQGDQVRIFAPETTLETPASNPKPITFLQYGPTQEGLSYSLITILSPTGTKQTYTWTTPTKNQPNQTYYALEGQITQPPEIAQEFTFTITETTTQKPLTIIFEEEILNFETAVLLLKPETKTHLLTEKTNNENTFKLLDFKIAETETTAETEATKTPETNPTPESLPFTTIIIPLILTLILGTTLFLIKTNTIKLKKRQKQI
jgi:hypothetical protein